MNTPVCTFAALALLLTSPTRGNSNTNSAALPACAEDGATVQTLAQEFKFTEGPTCDREGNVFFTDQPNNRIMKWSVDGRLSTFLQPSGRANGMFFAADSRLIACADEHNELWAIATNGTHTVLARNYNDAPLNGPNDVWVHPGGAMYFTDPFYQRPWWSHTNAPQPGQQVYRLAAGATQPVRLTDDLVQPNGIIGTADGRQLFVADIKAARTYRYDITSEGALTNRVLFCQQGSDGMTLDTEGNIFLTGKGVLVFDKHGQQTGLIKVPERWVANVSFGGPDHRTLFITASKGFYSLRMKYPGANAAK